MTCPKELNGNSKQESTEVEIREIGLSHKLVLFSQGITISSFEQPKKNDNVEKKRNRIFFINLQ